MMPASVILMICVCAGSFLVFIRGQSKLLPSELSGLPDWRTEWLRGVLMNHTGRDIGELQLHGGVWHALTANGWVSASDLLKQPKNPGTSHAIH